MAPSNICCVTNGSIGWNNWLHLLTPWEGFWLLHRNLRTFSEALHNWTTNVADQWTDCRMSMLEKWLKENKQVAWFDQHGFAMNIKDVTSNEQQICCRCKNTASDNKIRFDCCHNTCLINISTQCFSENVFQKNQGTKNEFDSHCSNTSTWQHEMIHFLTMLWQELQKAEMLFFRQLTYFWHCCLSI